MIFPTPQPLGREERAHHLRAMADQELDLLIVGGGVNGVWTALDARLRGLRVALVESGDFGHGPSRNNSELLHGGFRYLKEWYQEPSNWLKFRSVLHLVRDALREREVMMRIAPHLARPMPFCMPLYAPKGVGIWKRAFYGFGFWMYDKLAAAQTIQPHRLLKRRETEETLTGLRATSVSGQGLCGGGIYYDSKMEPGRLLIEVLKAAAAQGALVANYARATKPLWDEEHRTVRGFEVRDELSGETVCVRAAKILDSTGPWGDQFRKGIWPQEPPRLRLSKGVHIMVKQLFRKPVAAAFFAEGDDRIIFIIPWGEEYQYSLIGTTDTDYQNGPDDVRPDEPSIEYLRTKVRDLFPEADLTPYGHYAGLRPLIRQEGGSASSVSREHIIMSHGETHITSVFGGKWTTARVVASEILDQMFPQSKGQVRTKDLRLGGPGTDQLVSGGLPKPDQRIRDAAANMPSGAAPISERTLKHLIFHYGRNAERILALCRENPERTKLLCSESPAIEAEVIFAVREEMALHISDFLIRRSLLGRLRGRGLTAAPRIASLMGQELGWTPEQERAEIARFDEHSRLASA